MTNDKLQDIFAFFSFATAIEAAKEITNNTGESYCVLNGSKDEAHSFGYCVLTEKEANAQEHTSNRILETIYPQEKPVTITEFIAKIKAEHGGEYPFDCGFRDACDKITAFIED